MQSTREYFESLIEKATQAFDEEEAAKLEKKLRTQKGFDLDDFMTAMRQAKKMGSMRQLLGFIPGMKITEEQLEQGQQELKRFEAIICSMTAAERRDPRYNELWVKPHLGVARED